MNWLTQRRIWHGSTAACLFAAALAGGCGMASQGLNMEGARLHEQGNYQAASERFQKAIANDPDNPDSYYNIAATHYRLGKLTGDAVHFQQAENFYNQCLDRDANHGDCYRGLAVLLTETGRPDAAERLLEGWVTQSPTEPNAKIELARLREELGDTEAAKAHLLEALALEPNNARALTALGKLREHSGETVQALQDYQRSLAANRFQPQVSARVAAIQSAIGNSSVITPASDTRVVHQGPTSWTRY